MYTIIAKKLLKTNIKKNNHIPCIIANLVCQPRGTADEYLLKCAIILHLHVPVPVRTVTVCRNPIIPFT